VSPVSSTIPRDPEWEQLLRLTSIPLRQLNPANRPIGFASGCLVQYHESRLLLTVEHATGNEGRWAIEVGPRSGRRETELYLPGPMQFLEEHDLTGQAAPHNVDLSFAFVPPGLVPRYVRHGPRGHIQE
jgi:hypothetical protein